MKVCVIAKISMSLGGVCMYVYVYIYKVTHTIQSKRPMELLIR